jgi:hypothetical protein
MGSTSSASAKDEERNRDMQWHADAVGEQPLQLKVAHRFWRTGQAKPKTLVFSGCCGVNAKRRLGSACPPGSRRAARERCQFRGAAALYRRGGNGGALTQDRDAPGAERDAFRVIRGIAQIERPVRQAALDYLQLRGRLAVAGCGHPAIVGTPRDRSRSRANNLRYRPDVRSLHRCSRTCRCNVRNALDSSFTPLDGNDIAPDSLTRFRRARWAPRPGGVWKHLDGANRRTRERGCRGERRVSLGLLEKLIPTSF